MTVRHLTHDAGYRYRLHPKTFLASQIRRSPSAARCFGIVGLNMLCFIYPNNQGRYSK